MATYFVKDINEEYTNVISDYFKRNYIIYTPTMGGSQGEKASIHLMAPDKKHVLRISLDRFNNWENATEGVEINIKEYPTSEMRNLNDLSSMGDILWENKGKLLNNKKFYKISSHRDSFYGDLEAALEASKKHSERLYKHSADMINGVKSRDITSEEVIKTILPWVKRQYKCGSTLKKNISRVEKCIRIDYKTNKQMSSYRVYLPTKVLELKVS